METIDEGQTPVVIYLGDHDPSGMDMVSDIQKRLEIFIDQPKALERDKFSRLAEDKE